LNGEECEHCGDVDDRPCQCAVASDLRARLADLRARLAETADAADLLARAVLAPYDLDLAARAREAEYRKQSTTNRQGG